MAKGDKKHDQRRKSASHPNETAVVKRCWVALLWILTLVTAWFHEAAGEAGKDGWNYLKNSLTRASIVVSRQPAHRTPPPTSLASVPVVATSLTTTYTTPLSLINDSHEGTDIAFTVQADESCILGDPQIHTAPIGELGLMGIKHTNVNSAQDLWIIESWPRNVTIAIQYPQICTRDVEGQKLAVTVSEKHASSRQISRIQQPTENINVPPLGESIFNFTTINIPSGVTVRLSGRIANAPIFWLATGDVMINGTVDLDEELDTVMALSNADSAWIDVVPYSANRMYHLRSPLNQIYSSYRTSNGSDEYWGIMAPPESSEDRISAYVFPTMPSLSNPTTGSLTPEAWIRPAVSKSDSDYGFVMADCGNHSCDWEGRMYESRPPIQPTRLSLENKGIYHALGDSAGPPLTLKLLRSGGVHLTLVGAVTTKENQPDTAPTQSCDLDDAKPRLILKLLRSGGAHLTVSQPANSAPARASCRSRRDSIRMRESRDRRDGFAGL